MDIYQGAIIILFTLAISDLVVGVSNDAVNFLNSSVGSRVAPRHVIMIIASIGILAGSLLGVIALFSVPVTLLGCVSPFAIRLSMAEKSVESSGNIAGRLYALSTVGSLVGTFLPVLVLIPIIGTRDTFLFLAFTLMAVALAGAIAANAINETPARQNLRM